MHHGAAFTDYEKSYSDVTGRHVIPPSALKKTEQVEVRQASTAQDRAKSTKQQLRQVGDIMRRVNSFAFLACACGLKMKIPPNFKANQIKCPRCGKVSKKP